MSTFHQSCPSCGRTLELPTEGKGRLGKCPACEATFTIGDMPKADANSLLASAIETPDNVEPIAEPLELFGEASKLDRDANQEPFAPPQDLATSQTLQVTQCAIDDILSTTLSIFSARWKSCVASLAILCVATLLLVVLPLAILDEIKKAGATTLAGVGYMFFLPFGFAFNVFALVGFARVSLAVAKNEPAPLTQLIAPPNLIFRAMGVALLLSLVVGGVGIVMLSITNIVTATGNQALATLMSLAASIGAMAFSFGLAWQLWAWLFVCADEKGTAIGSIRAAQAITSQNKIPSFLVVLIALILAIMGTLMCLVGHVVTAPLTMLLFAVSYLMMTGQTVSDPKDAATFP